MAAIKYANNEQENKYIAAGFGCQIDYYECMAERFNVTPEEVVRIASDISFEDEFTELPLKIFASINS